MAGIDNNTLLYLRGDNFNDLSLSSKTVTNIGATIVDGGKFGKCMEFNNHANTKATIPLNYTFNSDFTISAYCNLLKNGTSNCYLIGSESSKNEIHFAVDKNGYLCVAFHGNGGQIITSAEKIPLNKIVHIAFVRKSGTLKCYIDGRCVGTVSYSGSPKITTVHLHGGVNTVWQMSSLEVSSVARWEGDFTPPTRPYNSININITNQTRDKIDFTVSKLGQEVVNKIELLVNGQVSKTYTSIGDLTYDIDKSLLFNGNNKIKIKVTFDNDYSEEKEIVYEYVINNLSTSSSLKELIDRQELLTNVIEVQKNTLKSILESKNVEVSEEENKLSVLINNVNNFDDYIPDILYLYKTGDEYESLTGGFLNGMASANGHIKKYDNYIQIISYYNGYSTLTSSNEIDISNYNCLVVRGENVTTSQALADSVKIGLSDSLGGIVNIENTAFNRLSRGEFEFTHYIKSSNNSYVCIACQNVNTINIKEIYLKKNRW